MWKVYVKVRIQIKELDQFEIEAGAVGDGDEVVPGAVVARLADDDFARDEWALAGGAREYLAFDVVVGGGTRVGGVGGVGGADGIDGDGQDIAVGVRDAWKRVVEDDDNAGGKNYQPIERHPLTSLTAKGPYGEWEWRQTRVGKAGEAFDWGAYHSKGDEMTVVVDGDVREKYAYLDCW